MSVDRGRFEHIFEESGTAGRSLLDSISADARAENRAAARGLVSIHNLYRLRLGEHGGSHDDWAIDTIDQVTAEVAAKLRISQGLAANRVKDAIAMGSRLPQVAPFSGPATSTTSCLQPSCRVPS